MNRIIHQAPLIRVAIPIILGVILATFNPFQPRLLHLFFLVFVLLFLLIYQRKKWKYPQFYLQFGLLYYFILIVCGFGIALLHGSIKEQKLQIPGTFNLGHAILKEPFRESSNSIYSIFELLSYQESDSIYSGQGFRFILYASKNSLLKKASPGIEIVFQGKMQTHRHTINPHQFDYASFLEQRGIGGTIYVGDDFEIISQQVHKWTIENIFQQLQLKCIHIFEESGLREKDISVLNALVLGYRKTLEPETKDDFADAGVVHILAVSGLHVGIIYIVLQWITGRTFKSRWPYLQFFFVIGSIWFYAGVTGFSPSVLRASTMFSFIAFGIVGGKKSNTYNMLAASIILLLLINPLIVREIGFQLSYLAVFGIVYFHDIFKPLFWSKYWIIQKAWELFVVSISAQIATGALSIYYFGQFPNYFFLSNLFVIPMATLSLYGGLLYLILHGIPFIGVSIAFCLNKVVTVLTYIVSFFSNIPGAVTSNINFNLIDVFGIYLLIILITLISTRPSRIRIYLAYLVLLSLVVNYAYKRINSTLKSELVVFEGKKGPIVMVRNGTSGIFIPVYQSENSLLSSENEYYLVNYIRKEGINDVQWIMESNYHANNLIVLPNLICYKNLLIFHSVVRTHSYPGESVLLISRADDITKIELHEFDNIILDRTVKNYQREKVYSAHLDSSKIWDMNRAGVFIKSYSDFNF